MIKVLFNFLFSIIQLLFLAFIPAEIEILEQPSNSKHTDSSEQQTIPAEIETVEEPSSSRMAKPQECVVEEVMDVTAKVQVKEASSKVLHGTPSSSSGTEVSNRYLQTGAQRRKNVSCSWFILLH